MQSSEKMWEFLNFMWHKFGPQKRELRIVIFVFRASLMQDKKNLRATNVKIDSGNTQNF